MHIDEMERCLSVCFHDERPYQLAIRDDPDKGEPVLYVKTAQKLAPILSLIIGDAISNLYNSLDYLACELVTTRERVSSQTAFPITDVVPTSKKQKSRYEKQVCGMGEEVKKIIEGMEPYRGRDNNLWTLHKLNNINKHRALLTVAYGAAVFSPSEKWKTHVAPQEGAELLRLPIGFPDKEKIMIVPLIAFNEPEADIVSHPVMTVVKGCLQDVQRVADVLRPYRRKHFHDSGGGTLPESFGAIARTFE